MATSTTPLQEYTHTVAMRERYRRTAAEADGRGRGRRTPTAPQPSTAPVPNRSTSAPVSVLVVTVPTRATASSAPKAPWPRPERVLGVGRDHRPGAEEQPERHEGDPHRSERRRGAEVTGGGIAHHYPRTRCNPRPDDPGQAEPRPSAALDAADADLRAVEAPSLGIDARLLRALRRCAAEPIPAESLTADPLARICRAARAPVRSTRPAEPVSRAPRGPDRPGPSR